ncbi:tagaturonate epimerase family protein [Pontibacter silvestris]|uniref:Tagaturonate/fructuronate epimerase n=1 Tax=Pontibacter silvestris TaxID=2305183 RepID=A0ABW4WWK4_9BACT|nr:tagaturonate epimerase family protein [Pontibacter silvestris]MCC9137240.1 tagaturonate epimerase family protein [Pontibacter silvestris]
MKKISKYSFGIGDRFAHQGEAQLQAFLNAKEAGVNITPTWNKSNREHITLNTSPQDVRKEADAAVKELNWQNDYLVDADHINLNNVDAFLDVSDFFTIDVAEYIGKPASQEEVKTFIDENKEQLGQLSIPGIAEPFSVDEALLQQIANKFLGATKEAKNIYEYIADKKGADSFITEVSMDEVNEPQSPVELYFILKMLAKNSIPVQSIAPKFTGQFYKGVDYEGDIAQFSKEFEEDILVIRYAIQEFGLPDTLKLSVHSGSDKFSIYKPIRELMQKYDVGIHIKTAGTTWLEELAALAENSEEGLKTAKNIYAEALDRYEELTAPYATVLSIKQDQLPSTDEVASWSGQDFAAALRHDQSNPKYNPNFRQLIHCAYKLAGKKGAAFTDALKENKTEVGKHVTENLWERHIKPLFI